MSFRLCFESMQVYFRLQVQHQICSRGNVKAQKYKEKQQVFGYIFWRLQSLPLGCSLLFPKGISDEEAFSSYSNWLWLAHEEIINTQAMHSSIKWKGPNWIGGAGVGSCSKAKARRWGCGLKHRVALFNHGKRWGRGRSKPRGRRAGAQWECRRHSRGEKKWSMDES